MTNWKTTLIGLLLAGLLAIEPMVSTIQTASITTDDIIKLAFAFLVAALGVLAKDFNTTN